MLKLFTTGTIIIYALSMSAVSVSAKPMRMECISNDRVHFEWKAKTSRYHKEYANIPDDVEFIQKHIWEFDPEMIKLDGEMEGVTKYSCNFLDEAECDEPGVGREAKLTPKYFTHGNWQISRETLKGFWNEYNVGPNKHVSCTIEELKLKNAF